MCNLINIHTYIYTYIHTYIHKYIHTYIVVMCNLINTYMRINASGIE